MKASSKIEQSRTTCKNIFRQSLRVELYARRSVLDIVEDNSHPNCVLDWKPSRIRFARISRWRGRANPGFSSEFPNVFGPNPGPNCFGNHSREMGAQSLTESQIASGQKIAHSVETVET
jgi:hypothetical protein